MPAKEHMRAAARPEGGFEGLRRGFLSRPAAEGRASAAEERRRLLLPAAAAPHEVPRQLLVASLAEAAEPEEEPEELGEGGA